MFKKTKSKAVVLSLGIIGLATSLAPIAVQANQLPTERFVIPYAALETQYTDIEATQITIGVHNIIGQGTLMFDAVPFRQGSSREFPGFPQSSPQRLRNGQNPRHIFRSGQVVAIYGFAPFPHTLVDIVVRVDAWPNADRRMQTITDWDGFFIVLLDNPAHTNGLMTSNIAGMPASVRYFDPGSISIYQMGFRFNQTPIYLLRSNLVAWSLDE